LSITFFVGCNKSTAQALIPVEVNRTQFWTIDDEYAAIADVVPSFGGLYFKNEQLIIVATDLSKKDDIINVLKWEQKEGHLFDKKVNLKNATFKEGIYNFRSLKDAFNDMSAKLPFDSWSSLDIDEVLNRVEISLDNLNDEAKYRSWLISIGQDVEKFVFTKGREVSYYADLKSKFRPTVSGAAINSGSGYCTLGLNVDVQISTSTTVGSNSMAGFITASHCLPNMGKVTKSSMFQPERGLFGANSVGTEKIDPSFLPPLGPPVLQGCPNELGFLCRYSDAAFVQYPSNVTSKKGEILRVAASGAIYPDTASTSNEGIFTVLPNPITFSGTLNANQLILGQTVNKLGQKTGWTAGQIIDVCITVKGRKEVSGVGGLTGTRIGHLCTYAVKAGSSNGDSGGIVWSSSSSTNKIAGILFGGYVDALNIYNREFYFSPIQYVFAELGGPYATFSVN
jgi:hypothetical protein